MGDAEDEKVRVKMTHKRDRKEAGNDTDKQKKNQILGNRKMGERIEINRKTEQRTRKGKHSHRQAEENFMKKRKRKI